MSLVCAEEEEEGHKTCWALLRLRREEGKMTLLGLWLHSRLLLLIIDFEEIVVVGTSDNGGGAADTPVT